MVALKNSETIQIAEAKSEDALGITTVLYKTWLETYPNEELGITREAIEESYKDHFTEERIKKLEERILHQADNEKRLVAKENDQIVALITVIRNDQSNQLKSLYVLPEYQGRGLGTRLWNEAKKFIDLQKDTLVNVATYNHKTIDFYSKLGFVETGKRWVDSKWNDRCGADLPEMEMVLKAVL